MKILEPGHQQHHDSFREETQGEKEKVYPQCFTMYISICLQERAENVMSGCVRVPFTANFDIQKNSCHKKCK